VKKSMSFIAAIAAALVLGGPAGAQSSTQLTQPCDTNCVEVVSEVLRVHREGREWPSCDDIKPIGEAIEKRYFHRDSVGDQAGGDASTNEGKARFWNGMFASGGDDATLANLQAHCVAAIKSDSLVGSVRARPVR